MKDVDADRLRGVVDEIHHLIGAFRILNNIVSGLPDIILKTEQTLERLSREIGRSSGHAASETGDPGQLPELKVDEFIDQCRRSHLAASSFLEGQYPDGVVIKP
jgi:hypothetical protein